jgi:hypothetical protein
MTEMKSLLLGAAALAAVAIASSPSHATTGPSDDVCRVADPTGTPLNVRTSPYGTIVATFKNGDPVTVLDASRVRGNWWVYVGTPEFKPSVGFIATS